MRTLLQAVLILLLVGSVAQAQDYVSRATRGTGSAPVMAPAGTTVIRQLERLIDAVSARAGWQQPEDVTDHLCYMPGIPGTPDVIIPGTPGTPAIGDLPGTPGTPPPIIPGTPDTPGYWFACR
jgi:hypothetical protein